MIRFSYDLTPVSEDIMCQHSVLSMHYKMLLAWYIQHCTKNPIYAFPEMKLRGLVSNSYIHAVSLSDLYIYRICSQIHEC